MGEAKTFVIITQAMVERVYEVQALDIGEAIAASCDMTSQIETDLSEETISVTWEESKSPSKEASK